MGEWRQVRPPASHFSQTDEKWPRSCPLPSPKPSSFCRKCAKEGPSHLGEQKVACSLPWATSKEKLLFVKQAFRFLLFSSSLTGSSNCERTGLPKVCGSTSNHSGPYPAESRVRHVHVSSLHEKSCLNHCQIFSLATCYFSACYVQFAGFFGPFAL